MGSADLEKNIDARKCAEVVYSLAEEDRCADTPRFWSELAKLCAAKCGMVVVTPIVESHSNVMTNGQAVMFEKTLMPFGIHEGKAIASVPLEYLDWLIGQGDEFKVQVKRYLANKRVSSFVQEEIEDAAGY